MPVEYFIRFQGKCYDVGTRLKFHIIKSAFSSPLEGKIVWINHNHFGVCLDDGKIYPIAKTSSLENTIVEIIYPVYYKEPPVDVQGLRIRGSGVCPPEDEIFVGWVWYIAIMGVGIIFNDRLLIWIIASLVFFGWKNGFLNGGK